VNDIMALTKLNYNACLFADGAPITLKFANAVGEVLTAGPIPSGGAPLPFHVLHLRTSSADPGRGCRVALVSCSIAIRV
jgi:hypothetical protein